MARERAGGRALEREHVSNLAYRLLTAAVIVPIIVCGVIWLPPEATLAVAALFSGIGAYEVLGLFSHPARSPIRIAGAVLSAALVVFLYYAAHAATLLLFGIVGFLMISMLMGLLPRDEVAVAGRKTAGLVIATFYPGLLLGLLALMRRDVDAGAFWVIASLKTAFLSDTLAYFAGRYLGKHKLSPRLSPSKTVEGALGGIVGGCASTVIAHFLYLPELGLPMALVLGVAGSIVGQAGDLVESLLKRSSDVKDAGRFFPGHGGMMDRIDGAIFVAALFFGYLHFGGMT